MDDIPVMPPGDDPRSGDLIPSLYDSMSRGCCSTCCGTGNSQDIETNGRCWDCYGTGHLHVLNKWQKFKCGWMNFWSDFRKEASGFFDNYWQ